MKKYRTANSNIKYIIYSLLFFIVTYFLFSNYYKSFFVDAYSRTYTFFSVKNNEFENIKNENESLQNQISILSGFIKESKIKEEDSTKGLVDVIVADKVSFDILNNDIIYSDIILNKGSEDDVSVNAKVYISGMRLVGEIIEVYEKSSKLRLFSYNNLETELIIKNTTKHSQEDLDLSSSTEGDNLETSETYNTKDFSFLGIGDGSYGIKIKIPESFKINIGEEFFLRGDSFHPVGTVVDVKDIVSQKEKALLLKTNYFKGDGSSFYILK